MAVDVEAKADEEEEYENIDRRMIRKKKKSKSTLSKRIKNATTPLLTHFNIANPPRKRNKPNIEKWPKTHKKLTKQGIKLKRKNGSYLIFVPS